jgi:hypothetical protein
MNKEFIPYEEALTLKELEFDEPCFAMFMKDELKLKCYCHNSEFTEPHQLVFTSAPLYQQAFRWFRKTHGLYSNLSSWTHEKELGIYHDYEIYDISSCQHVSNNFKTYEEAELACLKKLIEIVKNK